MGLMIQSESATLGSFPCSATLVRSVYLDYNGSAPLDPRVAETMLPILTDGTGNASSTHRFGQRQAVAVDEAREHVAAMVGGRPSGVVFTAGATESNNLALRGAVEGAPVDRPEDSGLRGRALIGSRDGKMAGRARTGEAGLHSSHWRRVRRSSRPGGPDRHRRAAGLRDGGKQRDGRPEPGAGGFRAGPCEGRTVPLRRHAVGGPTAV